MRLDYLFISEKLLNDIHQISIKTELHSDHSIVTLERNSNKLNRGRVFWKFNNNLLHDIGYVNLIKKTISETKTNLIHYSDKGLV